MSENSIFSESPVLADSSRFVVKLAENRREIMQAQKLRYEVFKLEQGHLPELGDGIDTDDFDDYYLHLLVIEKNSGRVVGTYRLVPGSSLPADRRFYSEQEFRICGLDAVRGKVMEIGRSCVAAEFRSGAVVAMLWTALVVLCNRAGCSYLLGCVSLEHTICQEGWAIYRKLLADGRISPLLRAEPSAGWELPPAPEGAAVPEKLEFPPLFKGYLRCGAKICGPPALDSEFGSIDFLILFDFNDFTDRYKRHFNPQDKREKAGS